MHMQFDVVWFPFMTDITKHFLGWGKPFLPEASKWLQEHCLQGELGDAIDCVIVVSSSSVARRLQTLLIEEASLRGRAIDLPRVLTTSSLLSELQVDEQQVTSNSLELIATAAVLRSSPLPELQPLLGKLQNANQPFSFWLSTAKEVQAITTECLSGGHGTDSSTWPSSAKTLLTSKTALRFEAINNIQSAVQSLVNLDSIQTHEQAWKIFLSSQQQVPKQIVLLSTTDLHGIVRQALEHCANAGSEISAVIRAPLSFASHFDDIGCVVFEAWKHEHIDIPESSVHAAGSPSDQAMKVLQLCTGECAVDEMTVAVTSEDAIGYIRMQMEGHGIETRFAGGSSAANAPECKLIDAVRAFLKTKSFESYASLVRHPHVAKKLHVSSNELHHLDAFFDNHIPAFIGKTWFVPKGVSEYIDVRPVIDLHSRVYPWLSVLVNAPAQSIGSCAELVRDFILEIYGDDELDQQSKRLAALQHIFSAIDALSALPPKVSEALGAMLPVDVLDFIIFHASSSSIPEYPNDKAVEIVGWLESVLDDAPHLCIVGMDSSLVSSAAIGHPLIPGQLRKELGLLTVDRQIARDTHAVLAMQHERSENGQIDWIIARQGSGGESLAPSPLMLRCECDDALAIRTNKLLIDIGSEVPNVPPACLQSATSTSIPKVTIPNPVDIEVNPITRLSVTAFKDYLACSYRFWLRRALRVDGESDNLSELDYSHFGTLVHGALELFGKDEGVRNETSPVAIRAFLLTAVDDAVEVLFGKFPFDTILVQAEMAKHRLSLFAELQAERASQGWSITDTERKIEWEAGTKEKPFTVVGKIDRIDTHTDGTVLLLDYKTGSTSARKVHGTKDEWKDLQLPIYRHLAASEGLDLNRIETGFVLIGSKEQTVKFDLPGWSEEELEVADSQMQFVIESVQDMLFAEIPNSPAPLYSEDLSWICQDAGLVQDIGGDTP
jgi:ATP-dependent helicase/nuclease subunit B